MSAPVEALSGHRDEVIRLVQISDPHLFADTSTVFLGINPWESLNAVVDSLSGHRPDLLLISGDLSQDHSALAYQRCAEAVRPLGLPTFALPGNHDAPKLMQSALADSGVAYGRQLKLGRWQLLMLDSTVEGVPAGHLELEELRWLNQVLQDNPDTPTLVALHHHPKPTNCAWLDQHGLDNGAEFLSLVGRYPQVKAVLWGHVHQEMDLHHEGIRLLAVPSTSIQFKPLCDDFVLDTQQPGFRVLDLHPEGRLETRVHRVPGSTFLPDQTASGY